MQLAENCLTDDGQRIRKGTPVFGEVTGIDGERVLVENHLGESGREHTSL